MLRPIALTLTLVASAGAVAVACGGGGSSSHDGGGTADVQQDTPTPVEAGQESSIDTGVDARTDARTDASKEAGGGPTTTIAKARVGNVTTPITVDAFVTALAGVPMDYPGWYIEDPAGGPHSGVAVYCDPLATTPCAVTTEPALHDLIEVTGSISSYKGQLQLVPTAMKVLAHDSKAPPVATVTAADIAPTANSPYRGVFVSLSIPTKLVVDDVTPAALFDTACGAVMPVDAGAEGGAKDGGTKDAGPARCTNLCLPPVYSGFRAHDGVGNEVYIQAPFFHTDPLQSSPECLTQKGVVPVKVGKTFSKMQGILDVDPYSMAQDLAPVTTTDYTSP